MASTSIDLGIEPAQEPEPTEGTPSPEEAVEGSAARGDDARADFVAKAKNDPDWAWEQVRTNQSEKDRLRGIYGQLTPEVIQQFGGADPAFAALVEWSKLNGNPTLAPLIQQYRDSQYTQVELPKQQATEVDEYEDPDKKMLSDIATLIDDRLKPMQNDLNSLKGGAGQNVVREHTRRFLTEWGLTEEQKQDFNSSMTSVINHLAQTNPNLLQNMTYENYEAAAMPRIKGFMSDIMERRRLQQQKERGALATDGPSSARTTGREQRPEPDANGSQTRMSLQELALKGLNEACEDMQLDPLRLHTLPRG